MDQQAMRNVAMMTRAQLNGVLGQLEGMGAIVTRGEMHIGATSPKGKPVLSAARINTQWHVRAVPGLIDKA